jgi:uncharacterized protein
VHSQANNRVIFHRTKLASLLVVLLVLTCAGTAEKLTDIKPQGYVTDLAGVIDPAARSKIETLAAEVQQKTGAQIAVVTLRSLDGQDRDQFAADLYKHLGVGPKKDDRGVLVMVVPSERQYRIEVGYGLEPVINDARAGDIGRAMTPKLRANDYSGAVWIAVSSIAQLIAADKGVQLNGTPNQPAPEPASHGFPWWLPLVIFFGIMWLIRLFSRGGRGGSSRGGGGGWVAPILLGGMGGGGWGGGFGGSSGGYSGGGGGFGGFGGFGGGMSGGGGAGGSW